MSSTHLSLHVHIVFGTKQQRALIRPEWRERFHAYLGGAARTLEVIPQAVGGVARPSRAHRIGRDETGDVIPG